MKKKFNELKFYKFNTYFADLLQHSLSEKLDDKHFFLKLQLDLKPSYLYWMPLSYIFFFVPDRFFYFTYKFPGYNEVTFPRFGPEVIYILFECLHYALYVWVYLPKF